MARISDFKSHMIQGGARPSQFRVILNFPTTINNGSNLINKASFLCRAASIPEATVENIQVRFRGRQVNFAGERMFSPWTISIYNDNDFSLREAFENWSDQIQNYDTTNGFNRPVDYQVDMLVQQMDRNDNPVRTYKFYDAYPAAIGPITLDFENTNQIETFDVQIYYNYWTPTSSL